MCVLWFFLTIGLGMPTVENKSKMFLLTEECTKACYFLITKYLSESWMCVKSFLMDMVTFRKKSQSVKGNDNALKLLHISVLFSKKSQYSACR